MKIDVAVQSYKKPESIIYTLLSLKKFCGNIIDTVYINDDCSGNGVVDYYLNDEFQQLMNPIKLKVRINKKLSGYTHTLVTKEVFEGKNFIGKLQLLGHFIIKRAKKYDTTDDIRYQWAINSTDKDYLFLIHDDIKFYDNVAELYLTYMRENEKLAIVGDLGGSNRCPYGPCGENCGPSKILEGKLPSPNWPITGKHSFFHSMLGRYKRNCRINEWCCMLNVKVARELGAKGIFFGNYEGGGDVATFWFDKMLQHGYLFTDPLPTKELRSKYYLHWWQGHMGHSVWEDQGAGVATYEKNMILECIKNEFSYVVKN